MMPGLRSIGRVGFTSTVIEPSSSFRRASVVEARRQQNNQSHQQLPQIHPATAWQRNDVDRDGLASGLSRPYIEQQVEDLASEVAGATRPQQIRHSVAESCSGGSSGSEHEPNSDYLAGLVSDFMEVEDGTSSSSLKVHSRGSMGMKNGSMGEDEDDEVTARMLESASAIQTLSSFTSQLESSLFSDVLCAIQLSRPGPASRMPEPEWSTQVNGAAMRRAVMSRLRAAGYNAAVCKSRWDHSRGFPGGDYEYIDVSFSSDNSPVPRERLIVDLDFRAQFQVARPTAQFEAALRATPVVFVGRADRLQQLVENLSDACRRSLKLQGMHLPPWRKCEYLRAKWFAPYKRTTNPVAAPAAPSKQETSPQTLGARPPTAAVPIPFQSAAQVNFASTPQVNSGRWPESTPSVVAVKRVCQPLGTRTGAPRGVLGRLLQEQQVGRTPSPVS